MFTVPDLPYKYDALTSAISEEIMRLHHDKHHQTYVDKLNAALEQEPDWQQKPIEKILQKLDQLPDKIRTTVRNNGGGHYNHSLFWQMMTPDMTEPSSELLAALSTKYGSFEAFKATFSEAALNVFGSGWVWLLSDATIITTPNQDSPIMQNQTAILALDVWEHAYYLDYKNVRKDYVSAWWQVVNWQFVSEAYQKAR